MSDGIKVKTEKLRAILESFPSALVAYSGGVDSTLLSFLTHASLGDRMLAVTVASPLQPPRELRRAELTARRLGFPLEVVEADELSIAGFKLNPRERCYLCKKCRLTMLQRMAETGGWQVVLEGSNLDDASSHRPGRQATLELGARSPLEEAGLTKAEVRAVARGLKLPNWDAPPRPCIATRFPYGMELDRDLIRRVDAAEEELEGMGLRQVRVRLEAPEACRIEVGAGELEELEGKDKRESLVKMLRGLGFRRIALDLQGYRSGSMDEDRAPGRCQTLYIAEGYLL